MPDNTYHALKAWARGNLHNVLRDRSQPFLNHAKTGNGNARLLGSDYNTAYAGRYQRQPQYCH
jgi:hypothetical protein